MPYALDPRGAPLLLISGMAMHTQNLEADPRASLLVTQPGWTEDPLAGGRVTLMGRAARVPESERPAARAAYQHAFATTRRNGDVSRDLVGLVQDIRLVAGKNTGHRRRVRELGTSGGDARTLGDATREAGSV
jgi:hypothetical protein